MDEAVQDPETAAKDYYDILQVPRCATDAEIKRSYRKLVSVAGQDVRGMRLCACRR